MSDATPWLAFAWADLGVTATPGSGTSPRVHQYYVDAGHPEVAGDDTAWCAAFVGACLERAGIHSTRSLLARSYLTFGDVVPDVRIGAIAAFSRGDDPTQGHVGFVIGWTSDTIALLGGNQSHSVNVIAMPRDRLLGIRWPSPTPLAQTPPQLPSAAPIPDITDVDFQRALQHVLAMEGGYSNDPYDPGGPTNLGVTLADLASFRGIPVSEATISDLIAAVQRLTQADVAPMYLTRYWQPSSSDALPPPLALFHFDAAVNQGLAASARMLQQALAVDVDGEIGPLTLAAAAHADPASTLDTYAGLRRDRYRSLSTFWRFGKGWLARVDATRTAAAALIPPQTTPAPQQKETPMTDATSTNSSAAPAAATTSTTPVDPKWWGQSLTIWGTIITTLATVLPIVGPLLGVQISADMVHQLGDGVVHVAQAVGGVAGILMTIYGRTRAAQPLMRRDFQVKL